MTTSQPPFLPYGRHQIDEDDVAAVTDALRSGWLTTGPCVDRFEQAFAKRVGAKFAVSCSSGTAGLHLASLAAGFGAGDGVVVPALTFLATANAPRIAGAEIVFADVDPDTALAGPAEFEAAIGRADNPVKAIFPVSYAGQTEAPEAIFALAQDRNLTVIEDACHALGADYDAGGDTRIPVGACRHAHMTVFSSHPVKAIAMGEGGVVTTSDAELHARLVRFRNHGMVKDAGQFQNSALALDADGAANPWYYEMPALGLNYRASDLSCALGLSQLGKLDQFIERRQTLAAHYDRQLADLAPRVRPLGRVPSCRSAFHLYPVLIDFERVGIDRAQVMKRLNDQGIGTQVHYVPVHHQPYYTGRYGEIDLPGADAYYARTLTLPLFPAMSEGDVDRVVAALKSVVGTS